MNLYFLLEGRRTEPQLYRRWLRHAFPASKEVSHATELTGNSHRLKSAGGYPQILQRIEASIEEVLRAQVALDRFFVCLDAEEQTYDDSYAAVDQLIQRLSPPFRSVVIIQHCCIETWLLGNSKLLRPQARTSKLNELRNFFDVRTKDPEAMLKATGYATRAAFHLEYLKTVLKDLNHNRKQAPIRYSKTNVGIAGSQDFLSALVHRFDDRQHIQSFGHLVTAWRELDAAI